MMRGASARPRSGWHFSPQRPRSTGRRLRYGVPLLSFPERLLVPPTLRFRKAVSPVRAVAVSQAKGKQSHPIHIVDGVIEDLNSSPETVEDTVCTPLPFSESCLSEGSCQTDIVVSKLLAKCIISTDIDAIPFCGQPRYRPQCSSLTTASFRLIFDSAKPHSTEETEVCL
ncbi:hypothetical protein GQ43DRAFT_72859 [Delitschia confertaspora ATCC 74209]|uniref:Uncharacterized protein n=1 Tax=Delitschia confertaspora ATCC 74209 TaxID=1513339 RepID=A0A9P4MRH9_9PLEO|nr:hypothetical protein GQ43DRAFT_72859 [Delitschia confertaspora ATCC 74209]